MPTPRSSVKLKARGYFYDKTRCPDTQRKCGPQKLATGKSAILLNDNTVIHGEVQVATRHDVLSRQHPSLLGLGMRLAGRVCLFTSRISDAESEPCGK